MCMRTALGRVVFMEEGSCIGCGKSYSMEYLDFYSISFMIEETNDRRENPMKPKVVIIGILCVIALILILQNSKIITVQLLFWTVSASGVIMILGLLFIGFLIGYLLGRR